LLAGLRPKTTQPIFTKFGGKMAHGPWKKPLDSGHVRLSCGWWGTAIVRIGHAWPEVCLTATQCDVCGLDGGMRSTDCCSSYLNNSAFNNLSTRGEHPETFFLRKRL